MDDEEEDLTLSYDAGAQIIRKIEASVVHIRAQGLFPLREGHHRHA